MTIGGWISEHLDKPRFDQGLEVGDLQLGQMDRFLYAVQFGHYCGLIGNFARGNGDLSEGSRSDAGYGCSLGLGDKAGRLILQSQADIFLVPKPIIDIADRNDVLTRAHWDSIDADLANSHSGSD